MGCKMERRGWVEYFNTPINKNYIGPPHPNISSLTKLSYYGNIFYTNTRASIVSLFTPSPTLSLPSAPTHQQITD